MAPVRVAVYSPHPIVHEGLSSLLAKHPDRVSVVPLGSRPEDPDPDVVLYDAIALLEKDTRQLSYLVEMTSSTVLAVARDLRPDLVGQALATGVDGFFSISVDESELIAAIASAISDVPGEDSVLEVSGSDGWQRQLGADVGLTARETEVIRRIARGQMNRDIATDLFISINSVKTLVRTAYHKIGATNRAEAVGWAIRHGFASESES